LPGLESNLEQHGVVLPSFNFATIPNMPHYRSGPASTASCVTATDEAASSKSDFELYPNPTDGFVTISKP